MGNLGTSIDTFLPNAPSSPYLAMKFMGKTYDPEYNFLKSLIVHRATDTMGTFEFVIEDTMDLSLEQKFLQMLNSVGEERISFQYGWYQGPKSPWYEGYLSDYKPSFHPNFSITLTGQGILCNHDAMKRSINFKGNSATEIVAQICEHEGWNLIEADQSDPFTKKREFILGNVAAIDFIREKIEPEATVNGTPMQFYLHCDADGPQAYFVKIDKYSSIVKENYNFMIYAGNYGSVISFDPAYSGSDVFVMAQEAGFLDIETNEICVYGSEGKSAQANYSDLNIYGGTSPDKMKSLLSNRWYARNIGAYKATLEIWGNPNLKPMDYINIMPFRPDGSIHHSGGTYLITEVTDNIAATYTTVLTLVKSPYGENGGTMPFEEVVQFKSKE